MEAHRDLSACDVNSLGPGSGTSRSAPGSRFRGLDAARALACAWVVLFHAGGQGALAERGHGGPLHALASVGYLGVNAFVVLSGVVVARSATPWPGAKAFLSARFRRIFPLYAVVVLTIVCVAYVRGTHTGMLAEYPSAASVLAHLTFLHIFFAATLYSFLPPAWSLGLEWWLYLAYAAFPRGHGARLSRFFPHVAFAVSAIALVALRACHHEADEPGVVLLSRLWQFGAGVALAPHLGLGWGSFGPEKSVAFLAPIAIVLASITWFDNVVDPWMFRWSRLTEPLFWLIVFAALAAFPSRYFERGVGGFLARVGDASYAVYLVHDPVLRLLNGVAMFEHHRFAVGLFAAFTVGEVVHRWVEKPLGRWVRKL